LLQENKRFEAFTEKENLHISKIEKVNTDFVYEAEPKKVFELESPTVNDIKTKIQKRMDYLERNGVTNKLEELSQLQGWLLRGEKYPT